MRRIKLLATLVIFVFLFVELGDAVRGFVDGWNEAGEERTFSDLPITLSLQAGGEAAVDSAFCPQTNKYVPYQIHAVSVNSEAVIKHYSIWHVIFLILTIPIGLFMLYGFYCLIRMVIFVTRGEVFTSRNVFRMRCFVYGAILGNMIVELNWWLQYSEIASQVQFAGYEVASYHLKGEWIFYVITALLTEIFAVGVKLKQEQDLTI